jgi:hypothetical protein
MLWSRSGRLYVPWRDPAGGCRLCLLSDRGVTAAGNKVSIWADVVTGNGLAATQAVPASQPVYTAADSSYSGQPAIDMAGETSLAITLPATWPQPNTIYHVAKPPDAALNHKLYDGSSGHQTAWTNGISSSEVYRHPFMWAGVAVSTNPLAPSANVQTVCCVFNGASSLLCLNSVNGISGNVGAWYPTTTFTLGNHFDATPWDGSIVALLVFSVVHDLTTRTRVMRWLSRKYGSVVA